MTFRIEDKIPLTKYDRLVIFKELNEKGMKKLFPDRKIFSLYFDNNELNIYKDSIEGLVPRKKIRIRNYNDNKNYNFEIKISSVEGRYKKSYPIKINDYEKKIYYGHFDNQYGLVRTVVLITYTRMYYKYKDLRITIDNDIKFYDYNNIKNYFQSDKNVLEIKSPNLSDKDLINSLIPFEKKRFSKYTESLESLNLLNLN